MEKLRDAARLVLGGIALVIVYGVMPAIDRAMRWLDPPTPPVQPNPMQKPVGTRVWKGRSVSQALDTDDEHG